MRAGAARGIINHTALRAATRWFHWRHFTTVSGLRLLRTAVALLRRAAHLYISPAPRDALPWISRCTRDCGLLCLRAGTVPSDMRAGLTRAAYHLPLAASGSLVYACAAADAQHADYAHKRVWRRAPHCRAPCCVVQRGHALCAYFLYTAAHNAAPADNSDCCNAHAGANDCPRFVRRCAPRIRGTTRVAPTPHDAPLFAP